MQKWPVVKWSDLWQKEGLKIQLIYKNLTDWAIGLEKICRQRRNVFLNGCLHCSVVLLNCNYSC